MSKTDVVDRARSSRFIRTGHASAPSIDSDFQRLKEALGPAPLSLIILFISPSSDREMVSELFVEAFPDIPVIGCTTAGEISDAGYTDGEILAIGFPAEHFAARVQFIEALDDLDRSAIARKTSELRNQLEGAAADWENEFALLLVDGLSMMEDQLVSVLSPALGPVGMIGGSAGDGLSFENAFVLYNGAFFQNAAVMAIVRTSCGISLFQFDHLRPTNKKMVVTEASPKERLVHEINAEPAAREYARIVGIDPEQLSPFVFAAHPVVVQIGEQHHVRAIQRVMPNGDLKFFSAIDEGVVLTTAEPRDIVEHLDESLQRLRRRGEPASILACDCILRRIEAEKSQAVGAMSRMLSANHVVGFSTYGEQMKSVHVNQTLTGVAIYPPEEKVDR